MKLEQREEIRENLLSATTWIRFIFMLFFAVIGYIALGITMLVVLFQFVIVLLTGKLNERILPLGQSLSTYVHQILLYLTYNSDEKPFPFGAWPESNEYSVATDAVNLAKEPEPPQKME